MYMEGDHVGVQLQLSNVNSLYLDSCNRTATLHARQSEALKWVFFIAVSALLAKLIIKNISPNRRARRFSNLGFCCRYD